MPKWEVETDLIIHTKIKVIVDAEDKSSAIDAAADLLPTNSDVSKAKKWKAAVKLTPPKGVTLSGDPKAYHFEQASGADKAKRLPD